MPALGLTERFHGAEWTLWGDVAREAGAGELSGPLMPYGPGCSAAFFAGPSGNRLEVYVRPE